MRKKGDKSFVPINLYWPYFLKTVNYVNLKADLWTGTWIIQVCRSVETGLTFSKLS